MPFEILIVLLGEYNEQVSITRSGSLTIMGSTDNALDQGSNTVTIQHSLSAADAGSDDASGTFRVHKDNFNLYNVNIKNTVSNKIFCIGRLLILSPVRTRLPSYRS